jgi:hypothetical protein
MEILKFVWRFLFLITACIYLYPMVYMQYAFSMMSDPIMGSSDTFDTLFSLLNMVSLVTAPLLVYIPVEVFFHLHKVSTSE